jgi:hypothetical protein
LTFDSDQAKIFGDTGRIGRFLCVPVLEGNEDVFRNLVRNFRSLQQIADANQMEYTTYRLRLQQLGGRLLGKGREDGEIGLTQNDEKTNHRGHREHGEIRGKREFLHQSGENKGPSSSPLLTLSFLGWVLDVLSWLGLSLLLLLSRYGTSF